MTRFRRAPQPKGIGAPYLESLTGYLQRVANAHAIPPSKVFVDELLPVFRARELYPESHHDILRRHARTMNGAGDHALIGVEAMAGLTGRHDLATLSCLTAADVARIASDGIVARGKRWCPCCWTADGHPADRYERKLWALSVVDACAIHRVALMERCPACGLRQPAIASDVRVGTCSHCGRDLCGKPLALQPGDPESEAERRIWYAEQAVALVNGTEVVDMLGIPKRELFDARQAGLRDLAEHLRRYRDEKGILRPVAAWCESAHRASVETLFSVLWQARWPIARLFPVDVEDAVD